MIGITALLVAVIQILILSGLGDKTPDKSDYAVIFGRKSTAARRLFCSIPDWRRAAYLNEYPDALAFACAALRRREASERRSSKTA
jgi:hypothetical protein